jgi:hypothetical protein
MLQMVGNNYEWVQLSTYGRQRWKDIIGVLQMVNNVTKRSASALKVR